MISFFVTEIRIPSVIQVKSILMTIKPHYYYVVKKDEEKQNPFETSALHQYK